MTGFPELVAAWRRTVIFRAFSGDTRVSFTLVG
jgi:hypothetical protein